MLWWLENAKPAQQVLDILPEKYVKATTVLCPHLIHRKP